MPQAGSETVVLPYDDALCGHRDLEGRLAIPPAPRGIAVFVHGKGATRASARDELVARRLVRCRYATLRFDLLDAEEVATHEVPRRTPFDAQHLACRVVAAVEWLDAAPRTHGLRVALCGADSGASAALLAAAELRDRVAAVVLRDGPRDVIDATALEGVRAPVLLLVGREEADVRSAIGHALRSLPHATLDLAPDPTHLFESRAAVRAAVRRTLEWLDRHVAADSFVAPPRSERPTARA
jgi:pimeloyl-ACP methyl ester carboxylesterase